MVLNGTFRTNVGYPPILYFFLKPLLTPYKL